MSTSTSRRITNMCLTPLVTRAGVAQDGMRIPRLATVSARSAAAVVVVSPVVIVRAGFGKAATHDVAGCDDSSEQARAEEVERCVGRRVVDEDDGDDSRQHRPELRRHQRRFCLSKLAYG